MTNETNVEQWVRLFKPPFYYDESSQYFLDQDGHPILELRGWGNIHSKVPETAQAEKIQDAMGYAIAAFINTALTRQGDADTDTEIVAAMFEWAKRLKPELRDLLVDVHAIFAGWMNDEHWTEWDESVRLRVVGMQKKMENSNNPVYEDSWMWVVTQKQYDLFKILHKITGHYFTKEETFKIINAI
jgi:hypothetical protein